MGYEQRDNSGTSFKNQFKKEGDNKPLYRGLVMIDGVMYEISSWVKVTKGGDKFLSHSFQLPREREKPQQQDQFNQDDLPF